VASKLAVYEDEYAGVETSDTWRDAKHKLQIKLKQSEQECVDLKVMYESERQVSDARFEHLQGQPHEPSNAP